MLKRTQHRRALFGLSAKVLPGSKNGAGCTREVRQEPGRSCVSVDESGGPPMIRSRSMRAVLVRMEANKSATMVTGARRKRSVTERTTGSRSSPWYR